MISDDAQKNRRFLVCKKIKNFLHPRNAEHFSGPRKTNFPAETSFFCGLVELQYGLDVEDRLKKIAQNVPWAKNWPEDKKSFWNAEAFMWDYKISKVKRELITKELESLHGRNLDLGCGAYSYIPSVGLDISEKMLQSNDNCLEKITADLEGKFPLEDKSFNSVTAIFLLNYIKNYDRLLSEIIRVLKNEGVFIAVLFSGNVNDWQKQKEVNKFNISEWKKCFRESWFFCKFLPKGRVMVF